MNTATPRGYEGVIVLGMPRSGTTLLRRILNAHPNLCCPPETNLLNSISRFLREEPFAGGLSVGVVSGLSFSGIRESEILERSRIFIFDFLQHISEKAGKKCWCEKTAFDVFHIDQIERLCGDRCRYLCVFRHPLDVVCSIKDLCDKMEIYLPELLDYVRRYPAPLEAFAHAWVDVNERLLRFMKDHPQLCFEVQYEELVEDPAVIMQRLFEFLDEPADARAVIAHAMNEADTVGLGDWKTYGTNRITPRSVDRWKGLSEHTLGRLGRIVNPMMKLVGYEPIQVGQDLDRETAQRRYELGLFVDRMKTAMAETRA